MPTIAKRCTRVALLATVLTGPVMTGCMTDLTKLESTVGRLGAPTVRYEDPSQWVCEEIKAPGKRGHLEVCSQCRALTTQRVTMRGTPEDVPAGAVVTLCQTDAWVRR